MKTFRIGTLFVAAACLTAPVVFGQRMMGGGMRDFGNGQMAKIFGKNQAFTATADVTITDKSRPEPMQMESAYAVLNGNLRTETDMTATKGLGMPPQVLAQMKQMGMDRTISIYRSDKKLSYLVYPGLKAYCEIKAEDLQPTDKTDQKEPKMETTPIGKETVDGHPCVKNKVTFTTDDGKQHEMIVWNASDLKDFPLKSEMQFGGAIITTHFRDIKMSAPAASLFDPPTDYKVYGSMQEMMMANMQRMMPPSSGMPPGGAAPPQGGGNN
jgi:Domain of unknown function (DUF4412)